MTEKEIASQREAQREAQIIEAAQKTYAPVSFIKKHKRTLAAARGTAWAAYVVSFTTCGAFAGGLVYLGCADYVGSTGAIIAGIGAGAVAGWLVEEMRADSVQNFFVGYFSGEGSGIITKSILIGSTVLGLLTSVYGADLFGTATAPAPEIYTPKYQKAKDEATALYYVTEKRYTYGNTINNKDKDFLKAEKLKLDKFDELEAQARKDWEAVQADKTSKFTKYENIFFYTVVVFEVLFYFAQAFIFWFSANAKMMHTDEQKNISLQDAGADSPTRGAQGGGEPPAQPEPAKNIDIINMHNIAKLKSLYASYRHNFKNAASDLTKAQNLEKMQMIEKRLAELGELPPVDRGSKVAPRQIGF
jgi:hypothetical protein